jgi:3-oxoacyl-[acyl-carrier protein] reductase
LQADVSKTADIHHLFDQAIEHFGKVDILVNNAGTTFYKPIAEVTEEDFDKIFAINVKGTFLLANKLHNVWLLEDELSIFRQPSQR